MWGSGLHVKLQLNSSKLPYILMDILCAAGVGSMLQAAAGGPVSPLTAAHYVLPWQVMSAGHGHHIAQPGNTHS